MRKRPTPRTRSSPASSNAVRVPTLIAERQGDTYVFDIHLQGENETVFFDS